MSVIVTGMNLPKSCGVCHYNNSSCWCSITNSGIDREFEYHERLDDCPLKSIDGLIERIEQTKQYKGKSGNPYIDAHDVGLDRYFDLGLDKAIKIIKEYCEVNE